MEEKLTAKERVEEELIELDERVGKLYKFLHTTDLDLNIAEIVLLNEQLDAMKKYGCMLRARLSIWRDNIPKKEARESCNSYQ